MSEQVLRELLFLLDISIEEGEKPDHLLAILQAAGQKINNGDEAGKLLAELRQEQGQRMVDSVLVLPEQTMPLPIPLRMAETDLQRYRWTLTEEEGRQHQGSFSSKELDSLLLPTGKKPGYALYRLQLDIALSCGYHLFVIEVEQLPQDQAVATLQLIITPRQSYVPPKIAGESRVWGIGGHLHTLRSGHNWGIGDYTDLYQLLSWSAARGAATLQVAPLHSLASISLPNPYIPSCRSQLNSLFIDIEKIADFAEDEEVQSHCSDTRFQARLASLRNSDQIDYQAVAKIKGELFLKLWKHFSANHLNPETVRGNEFRDFQRQGGETLRFYAIFCAISEEQSGSDPSGQNWHQWPAPLQAPHCEAVADFAWRHESEIEFHQYLQWQAEIQLATVGRRSMELGLKIGLMLDFAYNLDPAGFESWYYDGLLLPSAVTAKAHLDSVVIDPAEGLPPISPAGLKKYDYKPFIEGLRRTMRYAGAVTIRSFANYYRLALNPADPKIDERDEQFYINSPFIDLLGILCLESRRNRCLLIADNIDFLPEDLQQEVTRRNIFSSTNLFRAQGEQGDWLEPANYAANSAVSTSASFLASMKGFWQGKDITLKTTERYYSNDAERERAILSRVSTRAHVLIGLNRAGLLEEDTPLDPSVLAGIGHTLIMAGQILLARSPAKILLIAINDILELDIQAEPPAMSRQHFWYLRLACELDNPEVDQILEPLFAALYRERDVGVVHPSVLSPDRRKRRGLNIPIAFYRLQLNKDFSFRQAAEIVPYLKNIGISHCYVSPFLTARPGSSHGYDIIDHNSLNPEIGSREDFEGFMTALNENAMALLLDIVPNHMGIGSDNQWWMDVLENGRTSLYAHFFDINWQPQQSDLIGRVLLPILGDHYGKILESRQLSLSFSQESGNFAIAYYQHRFPLDPATYPAILGHDLQRLSNRLGKEESGYLELHNLISSFANLPDRQEKSDERILIRHRDKEVSKRNLARLCRECPEILQFIEENVFLFNGEPDKPQSFDLLHQLLEQQAYRLAYWRVAADEINYRRFFDINDLAGLRMEEDEVFRTTHQLVLDLITTGKVDGLRVDHPDGLYHPYQYFRRLEAAAVGESFDDIQTTGPKSSNRTEISLYVVAEKILAGFEHLAEDWPVCGTTGYDFSNLVNGLLLNSSAEKPLTSLYHRFIGSRLDFDELVYASKKLIIDSAMVGELNVLATLLFRLAGTKRSSRDFTLNRLRQALIEIIACFPVYRTYIDGQDIHEEDVQFIEWAVARAKTKQQLYDLSIFDFIKSVLLLERTTDEEDLEKRLDFVMKFQQYTGPVMAKGLEDTAFYIYNRLLSLNEVGGDPKRFGVSVAAFHRNNQERMRYWPHTMLNSSTHDSKRNEDVRARINVLTEMVSQWRRRLYTWRSLNRRLRTQLDGMTAPSRNDEYAFYQNLLGLWPVEPGDAESHQSLIQRIKDAMLKGCREAKVHTSWTSTNEGYEKAVSSFIQRALSLEAGPFLADFLPFLQEVAWFGMLNSLSQVFLKLVSPGIPDIYQGNEVWRFCLVDPDNRRPVDYGKRQAMLESMQDRMKPESTRGDDYLRELLRFLPDGRAKMFVIYRTLQLRNSLPEVFDAGSYIPLKVSGSKRQHLCAFARQTADRIVIAVAPRLYFTLMRGAKDLPIGEKVWQDTEIILPGGKNWTDFDNIYSASPERGETSGEAVIFRAADLLRSWPLGLLQGNLR